MSEHPVDDLDQWEFDRIAGMAASMLEGHGHAFVDLQPGDGTTYKIVIVRPLLAVNAHKSPTGWQVVEDHHVVATSFGPAYRWMGHRNVDWTYVEEKWVTPSRSSEWTARVLARFLNTLADRMRAAD